MQNDFDARPAGKADDRPRLEELDDPEISDLPPGRSDHPLSPGPNGVKQRLLGRLKNVPRETFPDIVQSASDPQGLESVELTHDEGFDLEISDLPPDQRSHHLLLKLARLRALLPGQRHPRRGRALAARRRSLRISRTLTASAMLLLLLVLFIGNMPELRGRFLGFFAPSPSPTTQLTYFSQMVINNGTIFIHRSATPQASGQGPGPMPSTCPRTSTLLYFTTPLDPPGLGAGPVWLSGFTGPTAALDNLALVKPASQKIWYETLAIFIQKGFTGNVTLKGSIQQSNAPILLGKTDLRQLNTSLTLNLNDGNHYIVDGAWNMTSVTLAVPAAGCYTLQASWDNHNSWVRYFAAGT